MPVYSGSLPTLHRRAQRATIDNRRARLWFPPRCHTNEQAEVMDEGFETPRGHPSPGLLIHRFPRWEVDWQHPPRRSSAHDLAQRMSPLGCGLRQQAQIGRDEGPFLITDIAWIGTSVHASDYTRLATAVH